jgi:hypothetical protein
MSRSRWDCCWCSARSPFSSAETPTRHGRNGWASGLLFLWQPIIVGIVYLLVPPQQTPADHLGQLNVVAWVDAALSRWRRACGHAG